MDKIKGRTIAITGAARGIGYATAKALLARGARVVIGDRDVATLESAVAGLADIGMASGHPLEVTDPESFATFLEQSDQTIRTSIEVNFCGVLTGCRLVARQAYEQRARAATGVVGSEDA